MGTAYPAVSVIIPVYNSEPFLRDCLESLCKQSFQDFELLCVDDGSTDASLQILREYAKTDARMRVYTQQNQFAGTARNHGIDMAAGEYLLFLDADDIFMPNLLELFYAKAKKTHADIIVCNAQMFRNSDGKTVSWELLQTEGLPNSPFDPRTIADKLFLFAGSMPWNKMFRHEFIIQNKLRFMGLPRANDLYFVYAALALSESVAIVPEKLVQYRVGHSSSLQAGNANTPCCFLIALQTLREDLLRHDRFAPFATCFYETTIRQAFYNFDTLRNNDAFETLYIALHSGGLCSLGINGFSRDAFASPALRLRFKWIMQPNKKWLLRSRIMRLIGVGFCELLNCDMKKLLNKVTQKLYGR